MTLERMETALRQYNVQSWVHAVCRNNPHFPMSALLQRENCCRKSLLNTQDCGLNLGVLTMTESGVRVIDPCYKGIKGEHPVYSV